MVSKACHFCVYTITLIVILLLLSSWTELQTGVQDQKALDFHPWRCQTTTMGGRTQPCLTPSTSSLLAGQRHRCPPVSAPPRSQTQDLSVVSRAACWTLHACIYLVVMCRKWDAFCKFCLGVKVRLKIIQVFVLGIHLGVTYRKWATLMGFGLWVSSSQS